MKDIVVVDDVHQLQLLVMLLLLIMNNNILIIIIVTITTRARWSRSRCVGGHTVSG